MRARFISHMTKTMTALEPFVYHQPSPSLRHHPAVDSLDASGRPTRFVGGEIDRRLSDFFRLSQTTDRVQTLHPRARLRIAQPGGDRRCLHTAGTDAVATDPLLSVMRRNRLRQHVDAGFGSLIGMAFEAGDRLQPADCRDVEDAPA